MIRFWSMGGILIVKGTIHFITVMESGFDNITKISAGKCGSLTDILEVNHNTKCITAIYNYPSSLEYIADWAKNLYHEYLQADDKVVHNGFGVGKIECFHKTKAYVEFSKIGKERNVSLWIESSELTKMR